MAGVAHGMGAEHERLSVTGLGQALDCEGIALGWNSRLELVERRAVIHANDERRAEDPRLLERHHLAVRNRAALRDREVARRPVGPADGEIMHGDFLSRHRPLRKHATARPRCGKPR
jgi:hypothetical protein